MVVICGDRFEQLAIAMAAAYLNKTIAHIEGGDVSGSIDESVRHAITKLSHIHFVTNEDARRRVLVMGEDPKYVFNTGSLDVEVASRVKTAISSERINSYGVGGAMDVAKPFLLVIQHPVTTETDNSAHLEETLRAVSAIGMPTIWIWPNPDAGTGEMAGSLRHFREHAGRVGEAMRFITDLPVDEFIALLKVAACLVGNSSAGIKECSFLGTPVVNIGNRQQGRLTGEHVAHVGYDATEIGAAIATQLAHGRYHPSTIYFKDNVSETMVNLLAKTPLYTQKRFHDRT
jgi:UDP-hydrolysing UDP-N-acetyl-D-glucosamine 2-epimerase